MAIYIDGKNGADVNDGSTWLLAVKTLDRAINLSASGNKDFYFKSGIYYPVTTDGITKDHWPSFYGSAGTIIKNPLSLSWNLNYVAGVSAYSYMNNVQLIECNKLFRWIITWGPEIAYLNFFNCGISGQIGTIKAITTRNIRYQNVSFATGTDRIDDAESIPSTDTTHFIIPASGTYTFTVGRDEKVLTGCTVSSPGIVMGVGDDLEPITGCISGVPDKYQSYLTSGFEDVLNADFNFATFSFENSTEEVPNFRCATLGWLKDPTTDGTLEISDTGGVGIKLIEMVDNVVSVLSPVYFYNYGFELKGVGLNAVEFDTLPALFQGITATPLEVTRRVEYRYSDTEFFQDEAVLAWNLMDRKTLTTAVTGKYLQFKYTFTLEGAL